MGPCFYQKALRPPGYPGIGLDFNWIVEDGFSREILKVDSQGGFSRGILKGDSQRMDSQGCLKDGFPKDGFSIAGGRPAVLEPLQPNGC